MNSNNIKELSKYKNISFGSHSYSHKRLDVFNNKELEHEFINPTKDDILFYSE